MNENIPNQNENSDSDQTKANPIKKTTATRIPWKPHFQVSEKEPSCIYFQEGSQTHFYDLQKISHCVFTVSDAFEFTLSGRKHIISNKAGKCLLAALKDWHERKDK